MSIYDSLNPNQREAVLTTEGPVLLLAGAGSGKTRVLTHRICYLIEEKGVNPYNILAITFTNKAAGEMRERVDNLLGGMDASQVWVSTFHSMCVRILRRYIENLGYDTNFTIYDPDDSKTLVKGILKRLNIDNKTIPERAALRVISDCKNRFISEQQFANTASDFREKKIAEIYLEYQREMKRNNALDFDDLLVKTVELFRDFPEVLQNYQNKFRYIHVDEYQDTNAVQFLLIMQLAGREKNLCVVGDDDQSIYKFRGADITNILSFEQHFPGAKVIKLEQNYRSTPNILEVANAIIRNNKGRKSKRLWSDKPEGERVRFQMYPDSRQEASGVIEDLISHVRAGEAYSDCAILYRTNAQSRAFEEVCILRNVPYKVVGGVNFYQRAEIKDILAYLKTIENGRDDLAVRRIINVPKRGIGAASVEHAAAFAAQEGISLFDALVRADEIPALSRASSRIHGFVNQIRVLRAKAEWMGVDELIEAILEDVDYESELEKLDEEQADAKKENLEEFINKAVEFEDQVEAEGGTLNLGRFLEEVALIADIDSVEDDDNRVLLMTLHGAKGLEFPRVYLCGMEEDLFPSAMSINSDNEQDVEEERRLCYVGVTRAMRYLMLTGASMRMVHGETYFHQVSRFVKEVPDGLLEMEARPAANFLQGGAGQASPGIRKSYSAIDSSPKKSFTRDDLRAGTAKNAYSSERKVGIAGTNPGFGKDIAMIQKKKPEYTAGDRVVHSKFGAGTVLQIEDTPRDYMVTVEFDGAGVKKMMAGFAKLEKK